MRVLIIGQNAMADGLISQYRSLGCDVDFYGHVSQCSEVSLNAFDELFLLPTEKGGAADEANMTVLYRAASEYSLQSHAGKRLICHWNVVNTKLFELLKETDFPQEINARIEVYPFTIDELWVQNMLCGLYDGGEWSYRPLDGEGIMMDDDRVVHLVVVGFSGMGRCLAMQAALVAHYPNYVRNSRLRTRITVISTDMDRQYAAFVECYRHLFANSHYRVVDARTCEPKVVHSVPAYIGSRADFVDVEWEFVHGGLDDAAIRRKIETWAMSEKQVLTIALCGDDEYQNMDSAYSLPEAVYRREIAVWVRMKSDMTMRMINHSERYAALCPFGMDDCGYDVRMPLVRMAKLLNYYYSCSFGDKDYPVELPMNEVQEEWSRLESFAMRYANIYNVMAIPAKMRSLGYGQYEWGTYVALAKEEIEVLAAVEHNRWNVERLVLGFRPCNDEERAAVAANIDDILTARKKGLMPPAEDLKKKYKREKVHYDICAYEELGVDATGKNVRVYDYDLTACLPLIVNSFNDSAEVYE